jgi:hypothetical protein
MAFIDEVAKTNLEVRFAVRISGIGRVWTTFDHPSSWPGTATTWTNGGETYAWDRRLIADERLRAIVSSGEPKRGIGRSGEQSLFFQLTGTQGDADASTDPWLELIAAAVVDRIDIDKTNLRDDLLPNATSEMEVLDASGFSGSGDTVYVGTETITYATTATSPDHELETLTRGRFGSQAQLHKASFNNIRSNVGLGPYVSTIPLAWKNRLVTLYLVTGEMVGDTFTPAASDLIGSENKSWTYLLQDLRYSNRTLELELSSIGIEALLETTVPSNQPTARAGIRAEEAGLTARLATSQAIVIDAGSWTITWQWVENDSAAGTVGKKIQKHILETDSAGTKITEGLYFRSTIARYVAQTIENNLASSSDVKCTIRNGDVIEGEVDSTHVLVIEIEIDSSTYKNFSLKFPDLQSCMLWAELGFEEQAEAEADPVQPAGAGTNVRRWTFIAGKRHPVFRYPRNSLVLRRLYYHDQRGAPFDQAPGWVDDAGQVVDGYVRVGNEIMSFNVLGSTTLEGWGTFRYLQISSRELFGSAAEEVYIEANETPSKIKWVDIIQGMAFPSTSWIHAMLYSMLGGSGVTGYNDTTYDQGWPDGGAGAFIPKSLVDVDSFELADRNRRPVRDVAIFEPQKLRDIFENEARLDQLMVTVSGGKFKMVEARPPVNGEVTDHTIDSSIVWPDSPSGVEIDISHSKIINRVEWKAEFDHGTQKFRQPRGLSLHVNSLQTYGETDALPVEVRSIVDADGVTALMADLASEVFARYSDPYAIVEFDTARKKSWAYEVGDTVTLSIGAVPKLTAAGRGISGVLARIYRLEHFLFGPPENAVRSRITIIPQNRLGAVWAPSMYVPSGTPPLSTWTTSANKYTSSDDGNDIDYFDEGDYVRIFLPGDEASAVLRTINTISSLDVTFDSAVSLTPPFVVEYADYDDASLAATQQDHLYMSDGDGVLDTDPAYRYV